MCASHCNQINAAFFMMKSNFAAISILNDLLTSQAVNKFVIKGVDQVRSYRYNTRHRREVGCKG